LTNPKVTEGVKNAENVSLWKTSIASITDLNSIFKKWEPQLILIRRWTQRTLNPDAASWGYLLQYHHLTDN
jgi:hypothetical protein